MPETRIFEFDSLTRDTPLIIDAIYKGGSAGNASDDPLTKILPVENQGGFRKSNMGNTGDYAFIVLYSTGAETEWPNFLDSETGIYTYYGDNRAEGIDLLDTKKGGNKVLHDAFNNLESEEGRKHVPPFLIFEKVGEKRDVKFRGLAVMGVKSKLQHKELVAFWSSKNGRRFQNYEAHLTVLDISNVPKRWLSARTSNDPIHERIAPIEWNKYLAKGREGIVPLKCNILKNIPKKKDQLPAPGSEGEAIVAAIRSFYSGREYDFEWCALKIMEMMDENFLSMRLTRKRRDGGRDAIGFYRIGSKNDTCQLKIRCLMEAKLYNPNNGVGVSQTSRLISRLRNKEFGVFVTTSYIDPQAYAEIKADGHKVLFIDARNIGDILVRNGYDRGSALTWLKEIDSENEGDYIESFIDQGDR